METDPSCAFCKIVRGEFPSHKIYEDDLVMAILSIDPLREGHALIIKKNHWPKIWSITDNRLYSHLMLKTKDIALALNKTFSPTHLIELAEGMDIQHAHLHLIPSEKVYGEIVATHQTKEPDHQVLEELAKRIKKNLLKDH